MGFFSKIGDAVKGVFSGVVDVIDKVTGGNFSKLLSNKWVKGALMAVSIVTGGIAIANGIMAAGSAGIGEAVKAFATNMTAETGKTLVDSLVRGGMEFVKGVGKGLIDPGGSDAGQALQGFFDNATSNITGDAVSASDLAAEGSSGAADAMNASGGDPTNFLDPGGVQNVADSGMMQPPGAGMPEGAVQPSMTDLMSGQATNPSDPMFGQVADMANPNLDPRFGQVYDAANPMNVPNAMGGEFGGMLPSDPMAASVNQALGVSDGLGAATQTAQTAKGGLLAGLKNSALNYAKSPQGMMTMAQMAQGWAQGKMLEERWDQMRKDEQRRYQTWTDGSFNMPKFGPGS